MLKVGDKVPAFSVLNEKSETITDQSLLGKKYILIFYPKDNTPGCTAAACSVRDNYDYFRKNGYEVFGVSPDSVKSHIGFIEKKGFQYSLLADTEKTMLNDFEVWGPKKFMGREYDGVLRSTIIINEEGKVSHVVEKVKTKTHGEQLMEILG